MSFSVRRFNYRVLPKRSSPPGRKVKAVVVGISAAIPWAEFPTLAVDHFKSQHPERALSRVLHVTFFSRQFARER